MIRPGVAQDLDTIEAALPALIAAMHAAGNDQWGSRYPLRADFARDLADGALYVDDEQGRLRGFVALNEVEPPEYDGLLWTRPRPALVVHRLAVVSGFQRRGVADGLFAFAETKARTEGFPGLRSDTSHANPGMNALFARRGWTQVGDIRFPDATVAFVGWEKRL